MFLEKKLFSMFLFIYLFFKKIYKLDNANPLPESHSLGEKGIMLFKILSQDANVCIFQNSCDAFSQFCIFKQILLVSVYGRNSFKHGSQPVLILFQNVYSFLPFDELS